MSRAGRALVVAVVATVVVVAAIVLARSPDDAGDPAGPSAEPSAPTFTPLADYVTDDVAVARASFCEAVAPEAVEDALGAAPEVTRTWDDGQRTLLAPGVRDIAHEFGCAWSGGGVTARAWVFAPPVDRAGAADLVRAAAGAEGCRRLDGAPDFGTPSTAVFCRSGGRTPQLSYRGLFGDAWLSCALSVPGGRPEPALRDRAGRLCVGVAEAARLP